VRGFMYARCDCSLCEILPKREQHLIQLLDLDAGRQTRDVEHGGKVAKATSHGGTAELRPSNRAASTICQELVEL
jgi:hypothetical protein